MLNKFLIGATASLSALVMVPSAAEAQYRDGYYSRGYVAPGGYYGGAQRRYQRGDYYGRGYSQPYSGRGYANQGYYGSGYANQGYYGNGYANQGYSRGYANQGYSRGGERCGSGTTGAIVGGAAGALLGREVARDGRRSRYSYRRGNDGTVGAVIGGVVGALVGREVSRGC